jgi:hypothetical protein
MRVWTMSWGRAVGEGERQRAVRPDWKKGKRKGKGQGKGKEDGWMREEMVDKGEEEVGGRVDHRTGFGKKRAKGAVGG